MIADMLKDLGPNAENSYGSADLDAEVEALKNISAHAIITTNYDEVIEPLFPDYERIIGQQIMRKKSQGQVVAMVSTWPASCSYSAVFTSILFHTLRLKSHKNLSYYLIKIARLGGYLARSRDPPPGNMVMWRGITRLIDIELGFTIGKNFVGN